MKDYMSRYLSGLKDEQKLGAVFPNQLIEWLNSSNSMQP